MHPERRKWQSPRVVAVVEIDEPDEVTTAEDIAETGLAVDRNTEERRCPPKVDESGLRRRDIDLRVRCLDDAEPSRSALRVAQRPLP